MPDDPGVEQGGREMKFAPQDYACPFCAIAASLPQPSAEPGLVFVDDEVFALVPLHCFAGIQGNCIVVPRRHHESVFDVPDLLGEAFFRATRRLAGAMVRAFGCEGVSTRQHNGPAGDQDVWHYHLHVFPRWSGDGLYSGGKTLSRPEERRVLATRLRAALD